MLVPRKAKGRADCSERPFEYKSRRRPTFPHSYPCSIIGPTRLNFRVRDGNGCDPRGLITRKLEARAKSSREPDNRSGLALQVDSLSNALCTLALFLCSSPKTVWESFMIKPNGRL